MVARKSRRLTKIPVYRIIHPNQLKETRKAGVGVMKPDGDVYGFAYPIMLTYPRKSLSRNRVREVFLDPRPVDEAQFFVFNETMKLLMERNMAFPVGAQLPSANNATPIVV